MTRRILYTTRLWEIVDDGMMQCMELTAAIGGACTPPPAPARHLLDLGGRRLDALAKHDAESLEGQSTK
jgi:hypothetical protein